jgi:1-acyl-sn-glycerol-3-phosphate acyltransferase
VREEEAAIVELRSANLPAPRDDLREQLPGLEPERTVTDWGRSERVEGVVDQVVYEFLYRYWFRVQVEGIENVPDEEGVLLVANHAGLVPPDGAMVAKAIREEHPRSRAVHVLSGRQQSGLPGIGMLSTKLGRVPAHPANIHRLLADERQAVLAFPEGAQGRAKPLKERYRLRPFDSGALIGAALRAGAAIVPVAIMGAEEVFPVLPRIGPSRLLARVPKLPLMPPVPLPAKFRIRFLEPVPTDDLRPRSWEQENVTESLTDDIRALIQENLLELVAERRSVWLG